MKQELGKDLDSGLSPSEKSLAKAYHALIEDSLRWVIFYERSTNNKWWCTEKGWINNLSGLKKTAFKLVIAEMIRKKIAKTVHIQGIGRHSKAEVAQLAKEDIRALSVFLADKPYLMGEKPTTLDATAFGNLAQLYYAPIVMTEIKDYFDKATPNLVAYLERMKSAYWPDWEEATTKLSMDSNWKKVIRLSQRGFRPRRVSHASAVLLILLFIRCMYLKSDGSPRQLAPQDPSETNKQPMWVTVSLVVGAPYYVSPEWLGATLLYVFCSLQVIKKGCHGQDPPTFNSLHSRLGANKGEVAVSTWLKYVDAFHIFSSYKIEDNGIQTNTYFNERKGHVWQRIRWQLSYSRQYLQLQTYDWIIFAPDDSYLILNLLREKLSALNPADLVYSVIGRDGNSQTETQPIVIFSQKAYLLMANSDNLPAACAKTNFLHVCIPELQHIDLQVDDNLKSTYHVMQRHFDVYEMSINTDSDGIYSDGNEVISELSDRLFCFLGLTIDDIQIINVFVNRLKSILNASKYNYY